MTKPNVLIFSGYGLNCEDETQFAFELSGAKADVVHINDVIADKKRLTRYQIFAFPGGFSYGDDTGSGNAYASKVKNHLWDEMQKIVSKDSLVIGICNGFQILVNLGLLPAIRKQYGKRTVALLHNTSARYTVRWVDLKVKNKSAWLLGIDTLSLPIAHGEGKLIATPDVLKQLKDNKQIALAYIDGEISKLQNLPFNPNGSMGDIAGITSSNGKILGLMPHPERAIAFTNLLHWTYLKEVYLRAEKSLPTEGPGLQLFKNAVNYFS